MRFNAFCPKPISSLLQSVAPERSFNERYVLGKKIGSGAFSITRLCKDKLTGELLACKIMKESNNNDDFVQETKVMKKLAGQPHIVSLKGTYEYKYIVMDLCGGGSLQKKKIIYTEQQAAGLLKNLMQAVRFCHSKGIIHRDITMNNILLVDGNDLENVKLADFGLATLVPSKGYVADYDDEQIGTLFYMAPEVFKGLYSKQVDVWSCGVVLYCILSGTFPFSGDTVETTVNAIMSEPLRFPPQHWEHVSAFAKELISGMLERDPKKRLSPTQIINHEWMRQMTLERFSSHIELSVVAETRLTNIATDTDSGSIQKCFMSGYSTSSSKQGTCCCSNYNSILEQINKDYSEENFKVQMKNKDDIIEELDRMWFYSNCLSNQ